MIGIISIIPSVIVISPGAIKRNDTTDTHQRSHFLRGTIRKPENATPKDAIPNIAPISVIVNSHQVNPSATSKRAGEYTNTKGTNALAMPSLNAVLPVLNGFEPAIPAAAYAANATGGVISARTP